MGPAVVVQVQRRHQQGEPRETVYREIFRIAGALAELYILLIIVGIAKEGPQAVLKLLMRLLIQDGVGAVVGVQGIMEGQVE
jgi:hypothetical protein